MKKLTTNILLIIVTLLLSCSKLNNDLTKQKLNGKVKSITESEYSVVEKFGDIQKGDLKSKNVYKYDDKGNLIMMIYYSKDTINLKQLYIRDTKGNVIELKNYDSKDHLESKCNF